MVLTSKRKGVSNLTKGVRDMKFMKRRKVLTKAELIQERNEIVQEKLENTKILAVRNEEFWEVKLPDGLVPKYKKDGEEDKEQDQSSRAAGRFGSQKITTCSQRGCVSYVHAHQSYGGFNKTVESFNRKLRGPGEGDEGFEQTGTEDMAADIDEELSGDFPIFDSQEFCKFATLQTRPNPPPHWPPWPKSLEIQDTARPSASSKTS